MIRFAAAAAVSVVVSVTALSQPPQEGKQRIHYGDLVDVDLVGSFDRDWRGSLTPEGFLDGLPGLTEPVFALCRTESEVSDAIRVQHSRLLKDPTVVVTIVDRSNRAVAYISGAVRVPHRLQLRRSMSLAEAVVIAGGITDTSSGEITIFRPPNVNCESNGPNESASKVDSPGRIVVKISDLLSGREGSNPTILSGDIVNVVQASPVFLTGGVAVRRRMSLTPDLTLSRAIASAGGIPKSAGGGKVRIYRRKSDSQVLEFDLRLIEAGKAEDPKLEAYDVIDVEERGMPPRKPARVLEEAGSNPSSLAKLPLRIVD